MRTARRCAWCTGRCRSSRGGLRCGTSQRSVPAILNSPANGLIRVPYGAAAAALPSSRTARPQPGRPTSGRGRSRAARALRARSGRRRRAGDEPVVLGPDERDAARRMSARPSEAAGAHRAVDRLKPGAVGVGADERGGVGGGDALGVRDDAQQREPPAGARCAPARQRGQRDAGERGGRPRGFGVSGRAHRPAGAMAVTLAAPRQGDLERDPAAERVAGQVRAVAPVEPEPRAGDGARRAPPGLGTTPPGSGGESPKPGRSTATTSRCGGQRGRSTGRQTLAVGARAGAGGRAAGPCPPRS